MRILLAEDDASLRLLLTKLLQKWNFEVDAVKNGEEALTVMAKPNPPRLVLLDWSMPVIDGIEVCQIIKKRQKETFGRYTHVIMLTKHDAPSSLAAALEAGANDFIKKPAEPLELHSRINVGKRLLEYENSILARERDIALKCLLSIAETAETLDKAGPAHMKRVAEYAELICLASGITGGMDKEITQFAPLHDIGKLGVSDEIYSTPGRLTPDEFEQMKKHATIGGLMLEKIPGMEIGAEICRSHHERWNGSGYPLGLSEVDIPHSARIVAVAEVYDALRSRRHYKEPWSHGDAMRNLAEESGEQFDPAVVDAFFSIEERVLKIAAEYEREGGDYT